MDSGQPDATIVVIGGTVALAACPVKHSVS